MTKGKEPPSKRFFWPGDENVKGESVFRFHCENVECSYQYFEAGWDPKEPPPIIPHAIACPNCEGEAVWCMPEGCFSNVIIRNRKNENAHYTREGADSEHKWMEMQIEESKKAIQGTQGASPYSKVAINHEYWAKQGLARKTSVTEEATRKQLLSERNQVQAVKAAQALTDMYNDKNYVKESKHIGKRNEG
jgi:hypothetical protein